MRAVMSDKARLQRMLEVEYALAAAEARLGIIPKKAIKAIGDACLAERYDIAALGEAAVASGNIAIPLVKACLLYTSPSPRDRQKSRMPSSA